MLQLRDVEEIILPPVNHFSYHQFVIRVLGQAKRDLLKGFLEERGIETLIHYKHYPPVVWGFERPEELYEIQNQILSLPIHPYLRKEEIDYVCRTIKEFFAN
jgi:dTDP-4-amino-4,6-dideoxygalactose transaminase